MGASNFCVVHVSLVPVLGAVGEQKTKPTQHSVAVLRSLGLNPALLVCRSSDPLQQSVREKLVRRSILPKPQPSPTKYQLNPNPNLTSFAALCIALRCIVNVDIISDDLQHDPVRVREAGAALSPGRDLHPHCPAMPCHYLHCIDVCCTV